MIGRVSFFEVMGQDVDGLHRFYGELFGWSFQPLPAMRYGLVPGQPIPGGVGGGFAGDGPGWTTFYVQVEDVAATAAAAERQGGRVMLPPTQLPDGMTIAVITDPEGHPVGLSSPPAG